MVKTLADEANEYEQLASRLGSLLDKWYDTPPDNLDLGPEDLNAIVAAKNALGWAAAVIRTKVSEVSQEHIKENKL